MITKIKEIKISIETLIKLLKKHFPKSLNKLNKNSLLKSTIKAS